MSTLLKIRHHRGGGYLHRHAIGSTPWCRQGRFLSSAQAGSGAATATTPRHANCELSGVYDSETLESGRYEWWMMHKCFDIANHRDAAKSRTGKTFSTVLPPPNVTGALHIGHALNISILDSIVRWRKMCGDDVAWFPGIDHAGIATQTVVEKKLAKQGDHMNRKVLGRERFLDEVWKWKDEYGDRICNQLKRMGGAMSWDHLRFTLDETHSAAVVDPSLLSFLDILP
jgi:valyl-tRNA synthetase